MKRILLFCFTMAFAQLQAQTVYMPVTFHLVANDEGAVRASEILVLSTLCEINTAFEGAGVKFFFKQFNYIDDTDLYSLQLDSSEIIDLIPPYLDTASINVFIVNGMSAGESGLALGNYNGSHDFILVRKVSFIPDYYQIAVHEFGHFLSLIHTSSGAVGCNDLSGPTPQLPTGCDLSMMEYANGSNCLTAGDFICDTPAEFLSTSIYAFSCQDSIVQYVLDPMGYQLPTLYPPYNYMSYFVDCDTLAFTTDQNTKMSLNANSPARAYCTYEGVPNQNPVTDLPTLSGPFNNMTIDTNYVVFEWAPVANASFYILEIDISSTFNFAPTRILTTTNSYELINQLEPNKNYKWRVFAFNENSTCAAPSAPNTVITADFLVMYINATTEYKAIKFNLSPNPVISGNDLMVQIEANTPNEIVWSVINTNGQVVKTGSINQVLGLTSMIIPTDSLPLGFYAVKMTTKGETISKAFWVVEG
jgi:hypothetical protein